MHCACNSDVELRCMSPTTPQGMMTACARAYTRAVSRTSSASMPQRAATRSGGYSAARAASSSKPVHEPSTKARS